MVVILLHSIKLDDRGMYAKRAPTLEGEVFGSGKVETGQVVGILVSVVKHDVPTACLGMAAWVVCSQYDLWCP